MFFQDKVINDSFASCNLDGVAQRLKDVLILIVFVRSCPGILFTSCVRLQLMRAPVTPILAKPKTATMYLGLFSMKMATESPKHLRICYIGFKQMICFTSIKPKQSEIMSQPIGHSVNVIESPDLASLSINYHGLKTNCILSV